MFSIELDGQVSSPFAIPNADHPFVNIARHFQLISEMSVNDLATLGHSIGFSPTLDNPKSTKYSPTFAATNGASGNGYSNNRIFASSVDNQTALGAQIQR